MDEGFLRGWIAQEDEWMRKGWMRGWIASR